MDITEKKKEFMGAVSEARKTIIDEVGNPRQLCNEKVFPAAVKLGYLDMCRTCSGIGKKISDEQRKDIFDAIGAEIKAGMGKSCSIAKQEDFDALHEKLCQFCTEQFKKYDYSITYGQARKSSIWRSNTYIAATMPKNMRKLFSLIAICHWTALSLNGAATANYAKNAARMRGASRKKTNMSKFSREYALI